MTNEISVTFKLIAVYLGPQILLSSDTLDSELLKILFIYLFKREEGMKKRRGKE